LNPGQQSSGDSAAQAFEIAQAHQRAGRLSEAIDAIGRAIALRPTVAEYHAQLGEFLRLAGKLEPSLSSSRRAIELKPDDPLIHNSFGIALSVAGKFDEAIVHFRRAINLNGDFAAAYSNLGGALRETGRLEETVVAMRSALGLNPNLPQLYINLGMTLTDLGEIDQAMATYDQCLSINPNFPRAHWNRSLLYLLRGDFPRGWAEYEWRWRFPESMKNRRYAQPRWEGGALQGKTIYIYPEQGFGDMMQFLRFLPEVTARGGKIVLESPPELLRLFQKQPGVERIVLAGETPAAFDVHCPLLSLAGILGATAQSIPGNTGYLKTDEELVRKWGERFDGRDDRLRVGLAWAGRPTHNSDRKRSMKLAEFGPLASVGGVAFYSLQKGDAAAQAAQPPPGLPLVNWTAELTDFAETAALIQHLDLIVSVDTAVVHLAGAMGKPVWVLLSRIPDWRWMLDREDSPWYPTVRLFRQRETGKWQEAIDRLREALSERARFASR
jgi:tetratricopeptide (TPR) repeat protein